MELEGFGLATQSELLYLVKACQAILAVFASIKGFGCYYRGKVYNSVQ